MVFGNQLLLLFRKDPIQRLFLEQGVPQRQSAFVLNNMGMNVKFVSRNPRQANHISYEDLPKIIGQHAVIVNASPAGMYPQINNCPDIPYDQLTPEHVLYDLVYNPPETLFLAKGKAQGAATINGLQMLHLQAERSWEIWNEK